MIRTLALRGVRLGGGATSRVAAVVRTSRTQKTPRPDSPGSARTSKAKLHRLCAGGLCAFGANCGRVFAWLQAAGGAAVGLAAGSVAHASEEEHGLAPANYPWSHEGPMSSFDAAGCANALAPNAAKPPSHAHARPGRLGRGCAKRAVQGRRHPQTRGRARQRRPPKLRQASCR